MTNRTALLATSLAALAAAGCDQVPADAVQDCSAQISLRGAATDILFVVDDSPSMADEQDILNAGLSQFIQDLASSPVATDYQFGVTTTSVLGWTDAETRYVTGPSATVPYPAGTIVAIEKDANGVPIPGKLVYASNAFGGPRILRSGEASLVPDFKANVLVGVDGSNREEPFRAARLALEKAAPGGPNAGFLRPGARLAVVFLSDEDDCSGPSSGSITTSAGCRAAKTGSLLTPVADVATFFQGPIGGEDRDVVLAAIVGVDKDTLQPSCGSSAWCTNTACSTATDQGTRFVQLLGAFPASRTVLGSICDGSFGATLTGIADAVIPSTVALDGAPADYRMLAVAVERSGVGTIGCTVGLAGADGAGAADAVYQPPQAGAPATLTFQNACALKHSDRVGVKIVCAR